MNFLEACKKVALRCGVSNTGPATVVGQNGELLLVIQWVLDAHEEICSKWLNWKFLWKRFDSATTIGQATIIAPDDLGIWDHNAIRLNGDLIDVEEYDTIKHEWEPSLETGTPNLAVIMPDNSLHLEPVPDAAYSISADYFKFAEELTNNTDQFLIPKAYQRAVIGRAMMFYAGYQNAPEVKQEGLEMYQMAMSQLESHELPENSYRSGVSTGSAEIRVIPQ